MHKKYIAIHWEINILYRAQKMREQNTTTHGRMKAFTSFDVTDRKEIHKQIFFARHTSGWTGKDHDQDAALALAWDDDPYRSAASCSGRKGLCLLQKVSAKALYHTAMPLYTWATGPAVGDIPTAGLSIFPGPRQRLFSDSRPNAAYQWSGLCISGWAASAAGVGAADCHHAAWNPGALLPLAGGGFSADIEVSPVELGHFLLWE